MELKADRHDLETRERAWWSDNGILARHWSATSSGRFGRRTDAGDGDVEVEAMSDRGGGEKCNACDT